MKRAAAVIAAPFIGLAFCVFLPALGFAMLAYLLVRKLASCLPTKTLVRSV